MEVVEDDLFFADLNKRISLLIMDDDDQHATLHCPPVSVSFQVISQAIHPIHNQIPSYHDQNGRRETKGTGVFIPQSSNNPRRGKQSRSKSSNTRVQTQRHADTSNGHFPHDQSYHNHNYNSTNTSYNSMNHKRYY